MNAVIGALRVNLGLDSARFSQGLSQAQKRMQAFGKRMQVVGAAMSAVGTGIALAVRSNLNAADEMGKAAAKLGVPVEELSRLRHAADMSGVSVGSLDSGLRTLSRNMAQGSKAFDQIGVSVRDADGNMRDTKDVMNDVADALARMPDGAEKTALAMRFFGKSGADLIPMLNGGAAALDQMRAEADALGLTISAETAASAANFNDNVTRLTRTLTSFGRILAAELAPYLEQFTNWLVELSAAFQNLSPQMRKVVAGVGTLAVVIGPVVVGLGILVSSAAALIGPFSGLAVLLAGTVKAAFVGLAIVIGALGAPITLTIAAIAALTAVVVAFWPEIKEAGAAVAQFSRDATQALTDWAAGAQASFAQFGADLAQSVLEVAAWAGQVVAAIAQAAAEIYAAALNVGAELVNGLRAGIEAKWEGFKAFLWDQVMQLPEWARKILGINSPSRVFAEIGGGLMEGLAVGIDQKAAMPMDALRKTTQQMTDQVTEAARAISDSFEGAFVGVLTGTKTVGQALGDLMRDLARMAAQRAFQMLFGAGSPGGGLLSSLGGLLFGGFRAEGGPVMPNKAYVVGERGPEMFVPRGAGQIVPNGATGGSMNVSVGFDASVGGFTALIRDEAGRVVAQAAPAIVGQAVGATYDRAARFPIPGTGRR
jgi:TP901 family phage tail tape measure protein